jgi:hypothetical protein
MESLVIFTAGDGLVTASDGALYRFGDDPVLFVGLGDTWEHRALLREVDGPSSFATTASMRRGCVAVFQA